MEIARFDGPHSSVPSPSSDLIAAFLAGRKPTTMKAYGRDLDDFAAFLRHVGPMRRRNAVEQLLAGTHGQANSLALAYRTNMTERKLAPATIARRLAALRSIVKLARTIGRIAWGIDISSPKVENYKDTRGPGKDGWDAMLEAARAAGDTPIGLRNVALLFLLHDRGLRRAEAIALDLADVDLQDAAVMVVGKGRSEKARLTVNARTVRAIRAWIAARGAEPGPLFIRLDPGAKAGQPRRLDERTAAKITHAVGGRAGLTRGTNPHGLRHQAITRLLDMGEDVRKVRKFSRHESLNVILRYDDNRIDEGGRLSGLLGDDE